MTFSFVSCSDDDDEVGPVGDLVGKWQSVSATVVEKKGDAEQEVTRKFIVLGLEFTADGKFMVGEYGYDGWYWAEWGSEDELEEDYGTYTYKNGKLTMTDGDNETEECNVKELTSSKLVIELRNEDGNDDYDIISMSIKFRKISD